MGTRIGTDYQQEARPTNTYTIDKNDDLIIPLIATGKTITFPAISTLDADHRRKIIGNSSSSAGNATYAANSADSIEGLTVMLPGQMAEARAFNNKWTIVSAVVDSGTGTTATSVADSKGESAVTVASKNKSTADSQNTSQSTLLSFATSAAISA